MLGLVRAVARLAMTGERDRHVRAAVGVHMHHARADAADHAVGAAEVVGPDAGRQPKVGPVGDGEGFFFAVKGGDGDHGAKDLFL